MSARNVVIIGAAGRDSTTSTPFSAIKRSTMW
jgi:hypothetical protein